MSTLRKLLPLCRPAPLVALAALAARPPTSPPGTTGDREGDLRAALAARGLSLDREAWLEPLPGLWRGRAMALARQDGGARDVLLINLQQSPEGRVLGVTGIHNVSDTSLADESGLIGSGTHAAWRIGAGKDVYRVELADVAGAPAPNDWPRISRWQHALTNWQRTGDSRGIVRRSFKLDPAAHDVRLDLKRDDLVVVADGHTIEIPYDRNAPIRGQRYVVEADRELARPGNLVTWAVDRARDAAWLGNERMQLIKAVAYAALDTVERTLGSVRRDDSAEQIEEELGGAVTTAAPSPAAADVGWPPPPIRPVFSDPIEGEGKWRLLGDDPFVATNPGAPAPVATSFVRTDEDRKYSRIFVAVWDPRQVDLHLMPGTEEPQSATGETGTGLIPRDTEVLTRLVGAFNGGFQSSHGDYGMMVDRRVLVPPRPYAATVALLDDGTTGFGTWPHDPTIDDRFVAFRQNLTPLVAGGELNPYGRRWWGGVPQGWEDETRTVRSGICLTKQGFIAYFYGSKVDHEHLGVAMQSAHCDYGLHLDMNQGHTGLEFYRVARADELPTLGRLDGIWKAEGEVRTLPGYRFRGRRFVKHMQLMHFPRYIRRSQRDFFYLTLRHLLPPPALTMPGAEGDEGRWSVEGLPQHGWPPAVATTELRPDSTRPETKARLLVLDPKFLDHSKTAEGSQVVTFEQAAGTGSATTLWYDRRRFVVAVQAPSTHAVAIVSGLPSPPPEVRAVIGLHPSGMAYYAEVATSADAARDGELLSGLLARAGVTQQFYLADAPGVALAGVRGLDGHPAHPGLDAVHLVRFGRPEGRRIFEQTPILPRDDWRPLQQQRRFFAPSGDPSANPPPE